MQWLSCPKYTKTSLQAARWYGSTNIFFYMNVLFARAHPLSLQTEAAWSAWTVARTDSHSYWQTFRSALWSKQEIVFKIELFSSFQLLEMTKRVKPAWIRKKKTHCATTPGRLLGYTRQEKESYLQFLAGKELVMLLVVHAICLFKLTFTTKSLR